MPWIKIDLTQGRTLEQKQHVAQAITEAMVKYCDCPESSVSIIFNDVTQENWAFGGKIKTDKSQVSQSASELISMK